MNSEQQMGDLLPNLDVDSQLWNLVRGNEQEALVKLYEKLYLHLVNYGIRISNDVEITKDAINDLFLELWDNRHKLPEVGNVKSYLFTYLRRKILAGIRLSKKHNEAAGKLAETADTHQWSYEDYIVAIQTSDEIRQKISRAMANLTPRQKELIQLRYFDGLSMEELSLRTGIAPKTAYNTLASALKSLSVELIVLLLLIR
ncbi:sigma-70 family RNA polymerase sigma factor [Chitinophaga silvatica]|uniref:Sigma-70 family RNA polymerase sigma factor n=1 Tax=Chitinophaga silvatica TaxID=2282649 RepID=A0A3E1Y9C8_9BACT|nr:sigma-70 family RNA polymerase sigma factor [Chitinophaga silvatica]RFS21961.1 sigma-70 family RNA polymerase sigma factor [Chitinophaga silvatica]